MVVIELGDLAFGSETRLWSARNFNVSGFSPSGRVSFGECYYFDT